MRPKEEQENQNIPQLALKSTDVFIPHFNNPLPDCCSMGNVLISQFGPQHEKDGTELLVFDDID
jgi:hypothetical protein